MNAPHITGSLHILIYNIPDLTLGIYQSASADERGFFVY